MAAVPAKQVSNYTLSLYKMVNEYIKNAEGQFICPHCDYTARIRSTMFYHLKKHEGALPYPCKHCDARFLQNALLDMHVKSRHADKLENRETFKCPCSGCEYEDIRKGNRLIHFLRIHLKDFTNSLKGKSLEEETVVSCNECNRSFKSMTLFYYHASKCVKLEKSHEHYGTWNSIKA